MWNLLIQKIALDFLSMPKKASLYVPLPIFFTILKRLNDFLFIKNADFCWTLDCVLSCECRWSIGIFISFWLSDSTCLKGDSCLLGGETAFFRQKLPDWPIFCWVTFVLWSFLDMIFFYKLLVELSFSMSFLSRLFGVTAYILSVSYTHLDVYKRQT